MFFFTWSRKEIVAGAVWYERWIARHHHRRIRVRMIARNVAGIFQIFILVALIRTHFSHQIQNLNFRHHFKTKRNQLKSNSKCFITIKSIKSQSFVCFVGSIETIAGGWKSSYSFHSLINIFCFVLLLISSARFGRRPSHAMRILPFSHCVGSRDHPRKITERRRQQ